MKTLLLAATALLGFTVPYAANAVPIINFGQTSSADTIMATADVNGTTLTGTDVAVSITQIDAATATPAAAFLDFHATSLVGGAAPVGG